MVVYIVSNLTQILMYKYILLSAINLCKSNAELEMSIRWPVVFFIRNKPDFSHVVGINKLKMFKLCIYENLKIQKDSWEGLGLEKLKIKLGQY